MEGEGGRERYTQTETERQREMSGIQGNGGQFWFAEMSKALTAFEKPRS